MKRSLRPVLAVLLAFALATCGRRSDLAIPPAYATHVDFARESLTEEWEGPITPEFSFRELHCRKDGGLLVVFLEDGFGADGFAFAMQGPKAEPDGWAGGFSVEDPRTDPEVRHFFEASPEVPCLWF